MSCCPRGIAGWQVVLLAGLFPVLAGCGGREGPEQRVRAFIDRVVASVEARSLRDFPAYLAPGFRTEGGLTRDEALALVARYLLSHRTIHVFQRIQELELRGPDQARVVLVAALAGAPMAGPEDLARLKADLFRFDLELADFGGRFSGRRGPLAAGRPGRTPARALSRHWPDAGLSQVPDSPRIPLGLPAQPR